MKDAFDGEIEELRIELAAIRKEMCLIRKSMKGEAFLVRCAIGGIDKRLAAAEAQITQLPNGVPIEPLS